MYLLHWVSLETEKLTNFMRIGLLFPICLAGITACGGGGKSDTAEENAKLLGNGDTTVIPLRTETSSSVTGQQPIGPDELPPTANITFPLMNALTDAESIVVYGTSNDASPIAAVSVNGIAASSDDGFATWNARIALKQGVNQLSVETRDLAANSSQAAATSIVNRNIAMSEPTDIAVDRDRALVVDRQMQSVIAVDIATGHRSTFSNSKSGSGFPDPHHIVVDRAHNRALVTDQGFRGLIAVDLDTGRSRVFSAGPIGSGVTLYQPRTLALDSLNNRALVVDTLLEAIIAIDLDTGFRSVFSGIETGLGSRFFNIYDIAVDSVNNRALVLVSNDEYGSFGKKSNRAWNTPRYASLIGVDLDTGDRTPLSNYSVSEGIPFTSPYSVGVQTLQNRALIVDFYSSSLYDVDLANGNRKVLSTDQSDLNLRPYHLDINTEGDRAVIMSAPSQDTLLSIDLDTGSRSTISHGLAGTGTDLIYPVSLASASNDRLLVLESNKIESRLVWLNLNTGNRRTLSNVFTDTDAFFSCPQSLVLDEENNHAYVADVEKQRVIQVDLRDGKREDIVPVDSHQYDFGGPHYMAKYKNRLLLVEDGLPDGEYHLSWMDLATRERSLFSGSQAGVGVSFKQPGSVIIDEARNRALLVDSARKALLAVDLNTGNRSVLSDAFNGEGTPLLEPYDLAMYDNSIIVLDKGQQALIRVDLSTGDRTILSNDRVGNGTKFGPEMQSLKVIQDHAFVLDSAFEAVFQVDLRTGDRVIISR